jgi:hypothetical protein
MTQDQLAKLIGNQCARYGEPSTLRAIASVFETDPDIVQACQKLADERARIYACNRRGRP